MIIEPKPNIDRTDVHSCPSIAGSWYTPGNRIVYIKQYDCDISSEYKMDEYYYEMKGHADGDKFEFTTKRTGPSGCTVIFYGRLTAIE